MPTTSDALRLHAAPTKLALTGDAVRHAECRGEKKPGSGEEEWNQSMDRASLEVRTERLRGDEQNNRARRKERRLQLSSSRRCRGPEEWEREWRRERERRHVG
jgi:hypothetical protein